MDMTAPTVLALRGLTKRFGPVLANDAVDLTLARGEVLALLGESLADGRELNLQPFGKLRINRAEEHANYRIVICKLRQQIGAPAEDAADPVADAAE